MMLNNKTIAFIGAGNMAEALIRGLLAAKTVTPGKVIVTDILKERISHFAAEFNIRTTSDNATAVADANVVVLAVKPQQMSVVLAALKPKINERQLFISIAAGVTTARIERELATNNSGMGSKARVVRVMPNAPALVRAGTAALCKGAHASDEDLAVAEAVFSAVGVTVRVEEKFMDAVTALSGSGPAYVFYVTEAMAKAGVEAGLDEAVAKRLARQTVYGAAKLLVECNEEVEVLRRKVTSPGGTTEAALKVMSERKLAEIFVAAVQAAARRSKELSGGG
ncbi:MAG: pyrroline-5-carboxylate reductase [Verrucomicrobiia bacterium]